MVPYGMPFDIRYGQPNEDLRKMIFFYFGMLFTFDSELFCQVNFHNVLYLRHETIRDNGQ